MKVKSLILSCLLLIFFVGQVVSQQPSQESTIPDKVIDEFRQDFWMTSKTALVGKYLIKVLLPRSYFKSDTTKYPVFYLTDADLFFGLASDFAYSTGMTKREIILVGISYGSPEVCWEKRMIDFAPYPYKDRVEGASHFLSFFREELIPKIESEFRADSTNRTLFGWSGGYSFARYVIFEDAELFHNYLIGGGSPRKFWVDPLYQKRKDLPIRLFIGNGDLDLYAPNFQDSVQVLEKKGFDGLEFEWEVFKGKRHEYSTVAELIMKGMQFVYGNKYIVTAMLKALNEKGIEAAIAEYNRLKTTDPDGYNFSEGALYWLSGGLAHQKRWEEAAEINKLTIQEYPDSWQAYYYLGSHYMYNGEKELAKKYLTKALELNPGDEKTIERLKRVQEE
ncbi:MAG: tetratricopeptide repeat protein [bacterium]|nr:MAG: tetratricopeptide repeat protein [bacterium]